ncbi:hypothetical protein HK101_009834 [Irineochytrium annulatum]|nr:hypothetical protein HK101_009834 [Irineochytrium annulatum]
MADNYAIIEVGNSAEVIFADAYVKRLPGIDWDRAMPLLLRNAESEHARDPLFEGRADVHFWTASGYVPMRPKAERMRRRSAARTMEYAYGDFCVGQILKGMEGNTSVAGNKLMRRSGNWRNLWSRKANSNGVSGFIVPKYASGEFSKAWIDPDRCSPTSRAKERSAEDCGFASEFYEDSSWAYSLFVPQNVAGLIRASGGKEAFTKRLDVFFKEGFYDPGNEPAFLTPFLYHFAGRPDKSIRRVDSTIRRYFNASRNGVPGNDDAGAMASWYIFASLGLFPVAGQDVYLLTSPRFQRSTLRLGVPGEDAGSPALLTIVSHGRRGVRQISRVELNGIELRRSWVRHAEIVAGGLLEIWTEETWKGWGGEGYELPPSYDVA